MQCMKIVHIFLCQTPGPFWLGVLQTLVAMSTFAHFKAGTHASE